MDALQKYTDRLDKYYARKKKLEEAKAKKGSKVWQLNTDISLIDAKLTVLEARIKKFQTCKNFLQKNGKRKGGK